MINVLSLFDGMSCGQIALKQLGFEFNYYSSEIDEHAIKLTQHNFPDTTQLGDIRNIKIKDLPKIDLLIGGSPCQGFSLAGKKLNFNDPRSALFFEYVRIFKETNPKYFLLENVKMKKEYQDIITEYLGVEPILINSSLVSAQNRERLYWTNIPNISEVQDKGILFKDIVNHNHELKPLTKWFFSKWGEKMKIDSLRTLSSDKSFCITTNKSHSKNYYLNYDKTMARMLELDEIRKLQNIPDDYDMSCISKTQAHKVIGNGWTIDVIKHIFKHMDF